MNLVYDVYLVSALCRCESGMIDNLTDIIHSSIAGCVNLYDINHLACVVADTIRTFMTGVSIWRDIRTVYSLRKYTSERRFTDTMKAKKYVPMMKCLCFTRIREDFFYKILTDDIGEIFRTVRLVERHRYKFKIKNEGLKMKDFVFNCGYFTEILLDARGYYSFL